MKRTLGAMLAFALAVTTLTPSAAFAEDRGHYGRRHHYSYDHDRRGDAVAAGIIGLALGAVVGAAVSNSHRRHRCDYRCGGYDDGYYGDDGYNGGDGYYSRPPALCVTRERRWDPYEGREVIIEDRRPC